MQKRYAAAFDSLYIRYLKAYLLKHLFRTRPSTIGPPCSPFGHIVICLPLLLAMATTGQAQISRYAHVQPYPDIQKRIDSLRLAGKPSRPGAFREWLTMAPERRTRAAQSPLFVIDTATIDQGFGILRHRYTHNPDGQITSDLTEQKANDHWENLSLDTMTYDASGNRLSIVGQEWTNGQWNSDYRFIATYNENGNLMSSVVERWVEDHWELSFGYISFTYDEKGNRIGYLSEDWLNGQLARRQRNTSSYDANGNLLGFSQEGWENGQWVNLYRYSFTYDQFGRQLSYVSEDWTDGQWVNVFRGTETYDTAGSITNSLLERWSNGQWVNSYHSTYTYDPQGNQLVSLHREWKNDQWVLSNRSTHTYDPNGNRISLLSESWYDTLWTDYEWVLDTVVVRRDSYAYDVHGNMISAVNEALVDSAWVPGIGSYSVIDSVKNYYYFFGMTISLHYKNVGTGISSVEESAPGTYVLTQNYPNPFNPTTTIRYALPERGHVTLAVFNALGQEVATLVNGEKDAGLYEIEFDARDLASGMYFYRMQAGSYSDTKRFLLIK